ncbi:ZIP family metal transporter [Bacillus halotolerans]|uniref:ZIP family metal transporter n=1 Tax=Bacillus halotolerans TaxID=260554 RepID=UPI001D0E3667|nr:ZIP family metal transporter [Bacillus halotolerans]MCC2527562.1 ZIP family metal transporter [Bacillus halotolerans]MDP4524481.1 ZIP family metal transporter [Bacillus halotolerans]
MWNAAMWGGISGSAVLLGALASMFLPIRKRIIGYIMAFGTGVLIGAAAYELLEDAVKNGGIVSTGAGFIAGAVVFTLFDYAVSKRGASQRKRSGRQAAAGSGGIAIFIGTIMDAVPESIMIGASLLEKQSVSFLLVIAIFISNIPEGLSSTAGMKNSGYSKAKILLLWAAVLMISIFASWSGYYFLDGAPEEMMSAIAAFAGGGIIAMIASTMMPEAYEDSGPMTGLIAALGLLTSLILNQFS